MTLRVTCPGCQGTLKVDEKYAGRKVRCPREGCGTTLMVPAEIVATPAEAVLPKPKVVAPREQKPVAKPAARKPISAAKPPAPSDDELPVSRPQRSAGRKKKAATGVNPMAMVVGITGIAAVGLVLAFALKPSGGAPSVALAVLDATPVVAAEAPSQFETMGKPFLQKYCAECHTGSTAEAGVAFDKYTSEASVAKNRKTFERTLQMVQGQVMPPADSAQPSEAELKEFSAYIEDKLFNIDCNLVRDPGRVTIRRLNKVEYQNTIRDLLGVDLDVSQEFPADDVGYGFDNIGDVLSLPTLLLEKYLDAADRATRMAIVAVDKENPLVITLSEDRFPRGGVVHNHSGSSLILVSTGEAHAQAEIPVTGEYTLTARLSGTRAGKELPHAEIKVDGRVVKGIDVKPEGDKTEDYEMPVRLARGSRKITVGFTNDFYDDKTKKQSEKDRNLIVWNVQIRGPHSADTNDLPETHKRLITKVATDPDGAEAAAMANLMPFAKRAFRRPVDADEVRPFAKIVAEVMKAGETFETGMRYGVQAVLVSPQFLFRLESSRNPHDPNNKHNLGEYELATRLAYFLWSSMPDDELFALAEQGKLSQEDVLEQQVRRMLADAKSVALVENFGDQWLQLRILNDVTPDPEVFTSFNDDLRTDMRTETRRFFEHVMRKDRSVLDFLEGQYTFVNERLAKHYGLPNVTGGEFREVNLGGTQRGGILTHGSVLTLTSNPNRTSPVKRGKWIMEVLLDTPPPPAPPNVPELAETSKASPGASLRQQMELHRSNPACASCHRVMDTLGFGLENFDAIGRYRDQEGGKPLDTSGDLPGGGKFSGPRELAQILKTSRQRDFVETLIERLLTYALGRGLEYYDRCTVNKVHKELRDHEYRFSRMVSGIVRSEPFRMRRGEGNAQ